MTRKGSYQTARMLMRRLIQTFAGYTYHNVGNLMSMLICQNFDVQNPNAEIRHEKRYDSTSIGMVGIPDIDDQSDQGILSTNYSFFSSKYDM